VDLLYTLGCRDITIYGVDCAWVDGYERCIDTEKADPAKLKQRDRKNYRTQWRDALQRGAAKTWTQAKLTCISPTANLMGWENRWPI
jgi:hypothetical protein